MKEVFRFIGILSFVIVLALLTGMEKQPWWFRLIYQFPIILLLFEMTNKKEEK
jgi:hypothetical protein